MNALKKQHQKWHKELIEWFFSVGVQHCEWPGCGSTFGVAPAHSLKRRFIGWSRELYFEAVYLCSHHHQYIEYGNAKHKGTHWRMRRWVLRLIKWRNQ